jgi:hypothetical protein
MRAILLATGSLLLLAAAASAGVAGQGRVSGRYRVVYVHVAGKAYASGTSTRRWSAVPSCAEGPCATHVRSIYKDGSASAVLPFRFDGTTYEWSQHVKGVADCRKRNGTDDVIAKAYDAAVLSRFRVTRMSASGRALVFKGTFSTRFTPSAVGRAHHCGYITSTERFTGYAITAG